MFIPYIFETLESYSVPLIDFFDAGISQKPRSSNYHFAWQFLCAENVYSPEQQDIFLACLTSWNDYILAYYLDQ